MTAKNTDSMNVTVKKYLSGEITFKEAIDIMYPLYLKNIEEIEKIISERKKIIKESPEQKTERAEVK